jgi:thioredoxin 1
MSIPYFAFIKKGSLYDDEMGAVPKERLVRKMEAMI